MKYTLGFSPCPNDTFIFDALINKKIDTEGLEFDVIMDDVESLNQLAFSGKLDITKLSYPAFFQNRHQYQLLDSGAALGKGVGPLLIAHSPTRPDASLVEQSLIALPGENTTAHLLFSYAYPRAKNKVFLRFEKIEDFVLGKFNTDFSYFTGERLGVIIHENRFTYQQKGLQKVMDLGEYWENKMKVPVPLGGMAIKRSIDRITALKTEQLIRKSIHYAFQHYPQISQYVKQHAQAMSEEIMRQHIELYVTDFSLSLGPEGRKAILTLFQMSAAQETGNELQISHQLFLS